MLREMRLSKFDIYQGNKQLQIVLRATQILDRFCMISSLTFTLSVPTGQSVRAQKKLYSGLVGVSVYCTNVLAFNLSIVYGILSFETMRKAKKAAPTKKRIRILYQLLYCDYLRVIIVFSYCLTNWTIQLFRNYQEAADNYLLPSG